MIALCTDPQHTVPWRRAAHYFGLCLGLVTLLMHCPQVARAQQPTNDLVSTAIEQSDTHQTYLPVVVIAGQHSTTIEQMAALLPSNIDCTNCLTRETFLALPAEELARIEQGEHTTRKLAEQLEQQDRMLRELIAKNEIDTSSWPNADETATMTPEEIVQVAATQSSTLATYYAASANIENVQAVNASVSIANLPAPNINDNINSCGPASVRVALSVRKPVSLIEDINTIGKAIDKNPDAKLTQGDWKNGLETEDIPRIATYLNAKLGFGANTPYYAAKTSDQAATFRVRAETTINNKLAMIFGTKSLGLPDWTLQSNHIITAYAVTYDAQGYSVISWADTAPIVSGHYKVVNNAAVVGAYYNSRRTVDLWNLASDPTVSSEVREKTNRNGKRIGQQTFKQIKANPKDTEITTVSTIDEMT